MNASGQPLTRPEFPQIAGLGGKACLVTGASIGADQGDDGDDPDVNGGQLMP
jgi:hypothetical protein